MIKKALVDLDGPIFNYFQKRRDFWMIHDLYTPPGPIQYEFPQRVPYLVLPPEDTDIEQEFKQYLNAQQKTNNFYDEQLFDFNLSTLGKERAKTVNQFPSVLQNEYQVI